jgi:hypothetical protein
MIDNNHDLFLKEIELTERCVERMADNSFKVKKWLSASLILFLGLVGKEGDVVSYTVSSLLIVFIILLWGLDAYFLALERTYRHHYDHVRNSPPNRYSNDGVFCLTPQVLFEEDGVEKSYPEYIRGAMIVAFFSKINVSFYMLTIMIIVVLSIESHNSELLFPSVIIAIAVFAMIEAVGFFVCNLCSKGRLI